MFNVLSKNKKFIFESINKIWNLSYKEQVEILDGSNPVINIWDTSLEEIIFSFEVNSEKEVINLIDFKYNLILRDISEVLRITLMIDLSEVLGE